MHQETSIEKAFKFITEVKKLSQIDVTEIEDQEIVLIMGPTGSGKSTFLNMMAGSKFQCKKNNLFQWEITAHPSVATVGHVLSQTFLPNYWKDQTANIFYCDCPGFHDTRGYAHDIAKSYFLKQIASYAKSLKIVAIFEISVLLAGRGSGIDGSIKQINALIEKFNFETDCILVVTKCEIGFQPLNAANILKSQSKYIIPEERIFLITQPDKEGILTCLDNSIIGKAPSIKQQCHIPLSEENFLKIQQLISTLDEQIRAKTKKLEQLIELSALDFYQNNLEATQDQIEHIQNLLDESKQEFKQCDSMKELEDKINAFCNHLVAKNCFSLSKFIEQSFKYIREINEGRVFLSSLLENESNIEVITENFRFSAVNKKKRGQDVGLQSYSSLVSYLRSVDVEITDLFDSVHNKLTANPPSIKVSYNGVIDYQGTTNYNGQVDYQEYEIFSGTANYEFRKKIQINVNYTQSISYTGSKSTPNCSHGNAIVNYFGGCMLCSHHQRQIPISGVTEVSGTLQKSHKEIKNFTQNYEKVVEFNGTVHYQGSIPYNGVVSYSSSQLTPCKAGHHQCSCDSLAYLIFAAGRIMEDIFYFRQIQREQIQQLNKFSLPFKSVNPKFQAFGFVKEVRKFSSFTEEQISDQLHLVLTQSKGTFVHLYHGLQPYKGSKPYSGIQKYSGTKQCKGTVNFQGTVPCSVTLSSYYQGTISKSVQLTSCYGNCNFCTDVYSWSENVSVNLSKLIARKYTNEFYYNQDVPYSGVVEYSGAVPYSGQAQYYGLAKFQGEKEVTCDQNHHDCSSCQKWVEIVDLLKVMLEDKETLVAEIQKNSQNLQETFQKIFA